MEHARRRNFLSQLLKTALHQILSVPHKHNQLAQVALKDLPCNCGAHSARSTRQKDTLTRELLLKLKRGLVRFRDFLLLLDNRLGPRRGGWFHGEKSREQVS